MKQIILKHLFELCATDKELAEKFDESKLDNCIEHLYKLAEERRVDGENCVAIDDDTVFSWARDYFVSGTAETEAKRKEEEKAKAEEATRKFEEEQKEREERWAKEKAEREAKERYEREHANGQTTIFDIIGG